MTDLERAQGIVVQMELLVAAERIYPSRILVSRLDCQLAKVALDKVAPRQVAFAGIQTLSVGAYLRLKGRIDRIEEWLTQRGR
ncbi:hypothetical protein [Caballeronia telluris]|uniref:Uncharacterized protein n=1 Tax=Caballeronia telluris TaxID=326475 RepID=A0A158G062_9BURK|nr:hypothetical protein [Caballeronia telluris]SAL25412.1 hypothetical protein AWB66_01454 [Caballeronia telluris]